MHEGKGLRFLLVSREPALAEKLKQAAGAGARVEVVFRAEEAIAAMAGPSPPDMTLLDEQLSGLDTAEDLGRILAAARPCCECPFPIVVLSDSPSDQKLAWMEEGMFDDVIARTAEIPCWRFRLASVLRNGRQLRELQNLRELNSQRDALTGVYDRATLLSLLFRETDRVQRMKSQLSLIVFDIDDFGHWNARLGTEACDELLRRVVERTQRFLRSYDLLGRIGEDEFLMALPGCGSTNATMLAERMRMEIFAIPFCTAGTEVRLSACFGIASSEGRSPVVVLGEATQALQMAKATDPETIKIFSAHARNEAAPGAFLVSNSADRSFEW